jgi:hypothetical protein
MHMLCMRFCVAIGAQSLVLKRDHEKRPIWVCPDGHIFLETTSAIYAQVSNHSWEQYSVLSMSREQLLLTCLHS